MPETAWASCMITRTLDALADPREIEVDASTLLSVAKASVHLTPSSESPTAKDFAGNSQSMFKLSNLCELPRSIVIVTGPAGSRALAQKVLELPSTALLAPCAAESAELLALIALRLATFVAAAVAPFWLKQYCPALPDFNWPF